MKVSEEDVMKVAALAHLELTSAEQGRMVKDLNSILDYVGVLNELDTTNVHPLAQTAERFGTDAKKSGSERFAYVMRADDAKNSLSHQAALQNAPESDGTFFKVPKVIER